MNDASTYGETLADIYDDLYGEAPANAIEVLVAMAGTREPVLELGIGTGRFALPMHARGVQVHGVDASPSMLEKLRAKPGAAGIPLTEADFVRILSETRANLVAQYKALLGTEQVTLDFADDAISEIARIAAQVNATVENIGARRLQTVMERLLEEISFEAEDRVGETVTVDEAYVASKLAVLAGNADLSKYIL